MSWISAILNFLTGKLPDLIMEVWRAAKRRKAQKEADRSSSDPAGAMADHFGGRVRELPKADKTAAPDV